MLNQILTEFIDSLHAKLCYQLFITPIHLPVEKEYREFARLACENFLALRTDVSIEEKPKPYVIHHFAQKDPAAKKVLITHGWISRAAYMVKFIKALHQQGYDVYAIDFPAHGEAEGRQLSWIDAVHIIKEVINQKGPFYALIGHSFGGSMLLNTVNLSEKIPEMKLKYQPARMVLLASPTRMHSPVQKLAKKLRLNSKSYLYLRSLFCEKTAVDIKFLNLKHFSNHPQTTILCIHGDKDDTVPPSESLALCSRYSNASFFLLPNINHVDILMDERVEKQVCKFLA